MRGHGKNRFEISFVWAGIESRDGMVVQIYPRFLCVPTVVSFSRIEEFVSDPDKLGDLIELVELLGKMTANTIA